VPWPAARVAARVAARPSYSGAGEREAVPGEISPGAFSLRRRRLVRVTRAGPAPPPGQVQALALQAGRRRIGVEDEAVLRRRRARDNAPFRPLDPDVPTPVLDRIIFRRFPRFRRPFAASVDVTEVRLRQAKPGKVRYGRALQHDAKRQRLRQLPVS
jgi:hypothetical protein